MTAPDLAALRELPDEMVWKGAEALAKVNGFRFGNSSVVLRAAFRHDARAVLEAAGVPALLAELEGLRKIEGAARALASAAPDFSWSSDRMDECRLYGDGRAIYELADRLFGLVDAARGEGR